MKHRARRESPLGITLDTTAAAALHLQIGNQLRRAILEGRLAAGTKLPSSRLMAEDLDCARGTILSALDPLIAEGYLISRAGAGVFVAKELPEEMPALPKTGSVRWDAPSPKEHALPLRTQALLDSRTGKTAPPGASPIAFPLGQPDRQAFPFPLWAKLMEREWRTPAWQVAGMPHPFGHDGLRTAIAAHLGAARGFACEAGNIVITSGVRESVSLFARIVLAAGDRTWIEEPGYPGVGQALAGAQVHAVPVPVDQFGFSPETAQALAPEARMAIVTPSHQYPLGIVMSLQRRLALLGWAERGGNWIIEDDFDGEYRYSGRPLAPLRALDRTGRVAYLGNFSKLLFPSLRLSYLVLPAGLADAAAAIMAGGPATASLLGQGALARFIADGHLSAHLRRTRLLYARRQHALIVSAERHLKGLLDIAPTPGGMHLIARPHPHLEPRFDDVAVTAAARGLSLSALSRCYQDSRKAQGLILGYAGTPDAEIDPAVRLLRDVMTNGGAGSNADRT